MKNKKKTSSKSKVNNTAKSKVKTNNINKTSKENKTVNAIKTNKANNTNNTTKKANISTKTNKSKVITKAVNADKDNKTTIIHKTSSKFSHKIRNINFKKFICPVLFFPISIFYIELIFKIFGLKKGFDLSVLYLLLYSTMLGMVFYLVSTFFNEKVNRIVARILMVLLTFLICVQFIYYKLFYTPMILYSLSGASQVAEFSNMAIEAILKNFYVLILFFVPVVVLFFKRRIKIVFKKTDFKKKLIVLCLVLLLNLFIFSSLSIGGKEINSNYDIYYGSSVPDLIINNFGILKLTEKDLTNIIFKNKDKSSDLGQFINDNDKDKTDDIIHFIDDENENIKNPLLIDERSYAELVKEFRKYGIELMLNKKDIALLDKIANEFGKEANIMNIDFDTLIKNESDNNIITMHKYFSSLEATNKNRYTGIFEDYNLIMITAEAFSHLAIDKDLTPTLYKMANESFVFNNFYTPVWGVSTSDGEYVACQSLIPKSGIWSFKASSDNYLPFVMGNQFKNLGYSTYAYHNHYFDYYRRDLSHPNMGYDYKGLGKGLKVKETWPESDLEMIDVTVPEYINDEKFHAYYMTVSGHKNYTFSGNYIASKNKELVAHLDASEAVKAYYACNIELDKAMENLLKQLEEKGILDKTVIAISADHYPYGLEKSEVDEISGYVVEENFELYKNSFILWANGRETVEVDRPCSSLDIIPTLSNMFGLEYDSRLLMGIDMFSNSNPLVIFSNRSFITDKVMYNSKTKETINLTGEELDPNYIRDINKIVSAKFAFSAEILDRNYYSYIFVSN